VVFACIPDKPLALAQDRMNQASSAEVAVQLPALLQVSLQLVEN
jgi:hypothetical protein